ncbi:hypothetical protein Rt10032_c08g3658 [Rhodotorula toruloides]|uniref:Uncharacterized protein n=1 Tax=Rhodotorula toruloides TaxID=5286 RepID=A0A511KGZ1_RHOTO|nr:hypothetical protein Rt10032_c08g3658 [Rhodotorula toruloides]
MYSEGEPTEDTKRAYGYIASAGYHNLSEENARVAVAEHQGMENLSLIRETLYSAFADVLVETPAIRQMLSQGPEWSAKAFFAATCLAIVEVALTRIDRHGVRAVDLGRTSPKVIGLNETPTHLRPFLSRLVEVSQALRALADADDARAVQEATEGIERLTPPKLDRLKERLAKGIGAEETLSSARSGVDGELAGLANAINTLALGMSALPAFRERQTQAFQVLASVTSL